MATTAQEVLAVPAGYKRMTLSYPGDCKRCGQRVAAGTVADWKRGSGILHATACETPDHPEPAGDLALAVDILEKLETEGRLSGFTRGLLDRYRLTGGISEKQITCVLRPALNREDLPSPEIVPAGHYALKTDDGDDYFVRVWRGKRNPMFVRAYLLHGPNEERVNAQTVCDRIVAQNPADCAIRYGMLIGKCCICNIRLTNWLSRELGIGPVCGGRFYDDAIWSATKANARSRLRSRGLDPEANIDNDQTVIEV
jgi:hypothetical protein